MGKMKELMIERLESEEAYGYPDDYIEEPSPWKEFAVGPAGSTGYSRREFSTNQQRYPSVAHWDPTYLLETTAASAPPSSLL